MNSVIKASLILVGVVAVLTVTVIVTGLHEQPAVGIPLFIFGAIFLNIVVVFWGPLYAITPRACYFLTTGLTFPCKL